MSKVKTYKILDSETGELLDTEVLLLGKSLKTYTDRNFIKFTIAFLSDIVQDQEVMQGPIRLLFYFVKSLDFNTLRGYIFPSDAMKELSISRMTFYRYLSILIEKKLLKRITRYEYEIIPFSAVKGSYKKSMKQKV